MLSQVKNYAAAARNRIHRYLYRLPQISIDELAPEGLETKPIDDFRNMPPRPDNDVYHNDLVPLLRIVQENQPARILELGTGRGNATANMCLFSDAHVFTVNALPEGISGDITTFTLSKDEIGQVYIDNGFQKRVTQIYGNTLKVDLEEYIELKTVDFALIDACHDTEYVLNDFSLVEPLLEDDAVVLLHDVHPSREGHLRGGYDACVTLRRRGYDIKHIRNTWWGYWEK